MNNLLFCLNYIEWWGNTSTEMETYFPAALIFCESIIWLSNKDLWVSGGRAVNHSKA